MGLIDLYKLLSTKNTLTRRQMNGEVTTKKPSDKKLDDFDQEAMEGWREENAGIDMNRLDKKMGQKTGMTRKLNWFVLSVIVLVSAMYVLFSSNEISQDIVPNKKEIISNKINTKDIVSQKETSETKNFQKIYVLEGKRRVTPTIPVNESEEAEQHIGTLNLKELQSKELQMAENRIHKRLTKEINLSGFNWIDYRNIKRYPVNFEAGVSLSGTPANEREKSQKVEETGELQLTIAYLNFIEEISIHLDKKEFQLAKSKLKRILVYYPDDVNASFYLGFIMMKQNEFNNAIKEFYKTKLGLYDNFDDDAEWLTALCLLELGEKEKATKLLSLIASSKSFYASQSKTKLTSIK